MTASSFYLNSRARKTQKITNKMFRDSCLCPSKSRARNKKIEISNEMFRDSCLSSSKFKAIYVQYTASNKRKTIKWFRADYKQSCNSPPCYIWKAPNIITAYNFKYFGFFSILGECKILKIQ